MTVRDQRTGALPEVISWLDAYLRTSQIPDHEGAWNGLQVENSGRISRILAAVDASQRSIEAAATTPGTLLLVHHGLFWDGVPAVTDRRYRRLKTAIQADIAVYSAHLPLDVHPEVGNNVLLAGLLGVEVTGPFGKYHDLDVGVHGVLERDRDALVSQLATLLGHSPQLIPGGPQQTKRVAIITGGAGSSVTEAVARGCDTYITGEGVHHTWFDAMEGGVNLIYAGHWATETMGVKAIAARAAARFGLVWEFFAQPTGL